MTERIPWPPALAGTPAVAVIERALSRGRLGHSLLLHGDSLETLSAAARALADRLLNEGASAQYPPERHPDCFALRPAGKMRLITAPATRDLIAKVQVSPAVSTKKVAILHEADRMNPAAANIFLKTLEEPPANTTLILLTIHPYLLLPTIRSRCLHFRLPADPSAETLEREEAWKSWMEDYRQWLGQIPGAAGDKDAVTNQILSTYGLLARFGNLLDKAVADAMAAQKPTLPEEIEEDEVVAIETGIGVGIRNRFFAGIEEATRAFARERIDSDPAGVRQVFPSAIATLESGARLLRLNLNESAVLEHFLLSSLRLWSRR